MKEEKEMALRKESQSHSLVRRGKRRKGRSSFHSLSRSKPTKKGEKEPILFDTLAKGELVAFLCHKGREGRHYSIPSEVS